MKEVVHLHHLAHGLCGARAVHLLADHQAGVVHQHLQVADFAFHRGCEPGAGAGVAHVQYVGPGFGAGRLHLGACVGTGSFIQIGDDDTRASVGIGHGDGAAYASTRACHQGELVFKQQYGLHERGLVGSG
mgnify:CR=1 FL=1